MAATHYISGEFKWAKILGEPRPNYNKDGREWTIDVYPDAESMKTIKSLKLQGKLKEDGDGEQYFRFKQRETRADGTPNQPIRVVGRDGSTPWDQTNLIGNGSKGTVKFVVNDYGAQKGVYVRAIQVADHVPYESQEFAPIEDNSERLTGMNPLASKQKLETKNVVEHLDDDLDDDIAF